MGELPLPDGDIICHLKQRRLREGVCAWLLAGPRREAGLWVGGILLCPPREGLSPAHSASLGIRPPGHLPGGSSRFRSVLCMYTISKNM